MKETNRFLLALRLLRRDWRAGELRVLAAALIIAVGATSAISFFTERLNRTMMQQTGDLLGADLALVSPRPVPPEWLRQARSRGLQQVRTVAFPSVVIRGERMQLSAVKAAGPGYPLRGELRISDTPYGKDRATRELPAAGSVWVDARLAGALELHRGDEVEVGVARFRVAQVLAYEPGRGGNFFAMAPRLLMRLDDLARTQVVQPGSRVSYQYLFAGADPAVRAYKAWLKPRLEPSHSLLDVHEGQPAVATALGRAERYLGLSVLVAVILAGVAVAMGARRYSERHYDVSAMLRCFGASQADILKIYLTQLALVALLASAAGVGLGGAAQQGLVWLLAPVLPEALPAPGLRPAAIGLLTGLVLLAGFALPPLLRLKRVPPLRVLRRDLAPVPASGWLVYGAALAAVVVLMWRYTGDWTLTFSVLAGAGAAVLLLGLLALGLLRLGRRLQRRVGVAWRFGLNNLGRRIGVSVGQILAFGLAFLAMAVIALVRTDLLDTWQRQLPRDAPNYFAVNIVPEQVPRVHAFLERRGVKASALYPLVRGRLTEINGVPVRERVSKESRAQEAIQRELNLTWTGSLQADNAIARGRWWRAEDHGRALVSVEERLARRMGIRLGDTLGFVITGEPVKVKVASLRTVQWDSFRPNFYMVFPPGFLDDYPATYMTSFHLRPEQRPLLTRFVRLFPSVTILDLGQILSQVRRLLAQVTAAIEYILVFVLLAGLAVLFAALEASLDERLYEGALLRTLGANRRQLRLGHLAEFCAMGLFAGLVAAAGTELIAYLLYVELLNLDYAPKWRLWIALPLLAALLVGLAGFLGTRRVIRYSPVRLFREV